MSPEQAIIISLFACIAGAVLTLAVSRRRTLAGWITFFTTSFTAVLIASASLSVLTAGPSHEPAALSFVGIFGFTVRFYVDGLAAAFLMLASFIAVMASLYSIRYMRHYEQYGVARYYPNFLLFLGGMYGILSTTDMMWFFFFFWQMMTLSSYMLIRFENKNPANIRAANKYLVMMQIACGAVMAGAALLVPAGSSSGGLKYDFDVVSSTLPAVLSANPGTAAFAFALFLIGFGIKMGMWPFGQIWLPDAHPAAPSPVSAMLSGVMIKTGVYGLLRYFLWLIPSAAGDRFPLAEWGMVVAVLGTVTLFTGTMQALKQEQSKRLLAFHSIGQIGYILLGAGVCMALVSSRDSGFTAFAAIGFLGALYHVINHGIFKSLLFLNAGSMLYATGTQDLNKLGGLMKFMPLTAVTAIVASFSISGVPLFNGFVSKWTIYVAAVQGSGNAHYLVVCAVIAILTSAITLASFIKFFGVSFLSRTSALVEERAAMHGKLEATWMMQTPQILLAAACILLGVAPAVMFNGMQMVLEASRQGYGAVLAGVAPMAGAPLAGVQEYQGMALFAPCALALLVGILFLLSYGISKLGGARRRAVAPWLCGYVREADCHRYTAHNFYGEIKRYFRWLGGTASHPDKHDEVKGH